MFTNCRATFPVTTWFEWTALSDEDPRETVFKLNRFLRQEGHSAFLREDDGRPYVAVCVQSARPSSELAYLLQRNGCEGYFSQLD
jgi:hypothetical protein